LPDWVRLNTPQLVVFAILLQLTQSLLVGYHAKWNDVTLTASRLRDRFSLVAYRDWMKVWLEAGEYVRAIAKPTDRIWLTQGLATAALTDSYLRDPYYAQTRWSKFGDLRTCTSEGACMPLFDYILTFPTKESIPPGFEVLKNFSNIAILRRLRNSAPQSQ
jgi:hypothetical protein